MRYVAFLRAINVGGHVVKMDVLRERFASLGYSNVETFIASGNVVFETTSRSSKALEKAIEKTLREKLGYEVHTFVRTCAEVAAVAQYEAFASKAVEQAVAFVVGFLADPLDASATKRLMALKSDVDDFHVHGREIYWLCRHRQSDSTFSNALFEKTLGVRSTFRGVNTVRKMAAKYPK